MPVKRKKLLSSIFTWNLFMILIPLFIAIIIINIIFRTFIIHEITRNDQMMLYHTQQNVRSFLHEAVDTLELIYIMAEASPEADRNKNLERINEMNQYYQNIEILNIHGVVTNTFPENAYTIGYHRSGEDFYSKILDGKMMYWSNPYISGITGEPTVILSIKRGENIIVGYLNLEYLSEQAQKSAHMDPTLTISVLDEQGIFVASNNKTLVYQRQLEPNLELIDQDHLSDVPKLFFQSKESIAVCVKNMNPNWIIVMYDDYTEELSIVNSLLYISSALLILSVGIFALLTLLRSSIIRKSINHFIKQTEMIASGNFNIKFADQNYEEFFQLSENFKVMANHLELRERELEQLAFTDSLTRTKNRAYLQTINYQENGQRECLYGMLYLDIDNFKNINDSYGHSCGDALLVAVSERLLCCTNQQVIVSRIGGDEFILIIPDSADMQNIHQTIQRIIDAFKRPFVIEPNTLFVTASIGISIGKAESFDYELMLRTADIAMYQAKQSGKNNVIFYDPEMEVKIKRRLLVEQNLRTALRNHELSVVYQPQMYENGKKIRGFEALVRWRNPVLGQVSPAEFIPIAEETGIILEIGSWVLEHALHTIAHINQRFGSRYMLAVNVSPVEMRAPAFRIHLEEAIQKAGVEKQLVELEITENVFLSNVEEVTAILSSLHSNHIQISLDDFGTGYSSLSYLNHFPISTLKIDKMFIQNMHGDEKNQKMVESIVLLAHKLELLVVAEGVETEEQLNLLNQYACECIQGFYFSEPLPFDELVGFIEKHNQFIH